MCNALELILVDVENKPRKGCKNIKIEKVDT